MGWRFRKSFVRGPLRWTVSRRGVGVSLGILPLRFGLTPSGDRYISFRLPGTGLCWIKYFRRNRTQPTPLPVTSSGAASSCSSSQPPTQSPQKPWWTQPGLKP
jgi:hypothetical protein